LFGLDQTNQPDIYHTSNVRRLIHQDHDIQRIPIFCEGRRHGCVANSTSET
jgi:hypothetical protein